MEQFSNKTPLVILSSLLFLAICPASQNDAEIRTCTKTAQYLERSCNFEARGDHSFGIAICFNQPDDVEKDDCINEYEVMVVEALKNCSQVFFARQGLCNVLGEEKYVPHFGEAYADNFINPLDIGNTTILNPNFPLIPGNKWIYEGTSTSAKGEEETQNFEFTVTNKTKLIGGVNCIVVNDIVTVNGEIVENTDDWYAQDIAGNVWYCGEIVQNFESFDGDNPLEPELTDIFGSWKAGRNGAKSGIFLPFSPTKGEIFRQEVDWGNAEDVVQILAIDATESSAWVSCNDNCLRTYDFSL